MLSKYAYLIAAIVFFACITASGIGGWSVRGWKDDSANLKAVQARQAADQETQRQWAISFQQAVQAVQKATGTRREITHEVTHNISYVDRPCYDSDLVGMFQRLAKNLPNSAPEVPGNTP